MARPGLFGGGVLQSGAQPPQQDDGNGIGGYLSNVGQPSSIMAPDPWQNRVGLFGAALKDAGASLSGRPEDAINVAGQKQSVLQTAMYQRQMQARSQLITALQSTDPNTKKQALIQAVGMGIDPTPYLAITNPQIEHFNMDENAFSRDPVTGQMTQIVNGTRRPLTTGGMTSTDNGKTWQPIPGYVAQRGATANAIDAARAANPLPGKPKPDAAAGAPNPWQVFGGK